MRDERPETGGTRRMDPALELMYLPVPAVVELVRTFDSGQVLTAADVASRWGTSVRTAQRWLVKLEGAVPLEFVNDASGRRAYWRKARCGR